MENRTKICMLLKDDYIMLIFPYETLFSDDPIFELRPRPTKAVF